MALASTLALVLLIGLLPPPSTPVADAAETVEIKLLATNDFHGRLLPPSGEHGGAAYLATHIAEIRAAHPNTLYVDAGDLVGATPVLSNLFYDEPSIEAMNLIGLDVQTVGNHEFDRGQDEILRRAAGGCLDGDCSYRGDLEFDGSDFTTLSTNVIVDATGQPLTYPHQIITVAGVDIGFIGVTTVDTPTVVHPAGIEGLTFLPEAEAVNATVPILEDAEVDIIVVLMHEGGRQDGGVDECVNFAGAAAGIIPQFDDAVDVVVTGHTHETYVCDFADGPLVTQALEYGKMFTEIDLEFAPATGEIVSRSAQNHFVTQTVTPDPAILALIEHYEALAGEALVEVVGTSEVAIPRTTRSAESAQGNLATDALIDQYAVDFAFQNSGGLRADLTKEANRVRVKGDWLYEILWEDVLEVWPFGNLVVLAEVDGPTLAAILDNGVHEIGGGRFIQVAGLRIDYRVADPDADPFPRGEIVNVEYWNHPEHTDGQPVDLSASASYTIAMNDFMALGGDGYPVLDDQYTTDPLEIAIRRYLEANSPVHPTVEGRIVDIDAPVVPTAREDCLKGGWEMFEELGFRNQGHCVGFVASEGRSHEARGRR